MSALAALYVYSFSLDASSPLRRADHIVAFILAILWALYLSNSAYDLSNNDNYIDWMLLSGGGSFLIVFPLTRRYEGDMKKIVRTLSLQSVLTVSPSDIDALQTRFDRASRRFGLAVSIGLGVLLPTNQMFALGLLPNLSAWSVEFSTDTLFFDDGRVFDLYTTFWLMAVLFLTGLFAGYRMGLMLGYAGLIGFLTKLGVLRPLNPNLNRAAFRTLFRLMGSGAMVTFLIGLWLCLWLFAIQSEQGDSGYDYWFWPYTVLWFISVGLLLFGGFRGLVALRAQVQKESQIRRIQQARWELRSNPSKDEVESELTRFVGAERTTSRLMLDGTIGFLFTSLVLQAFLMAVVLYSRLTGIPMLI